MKVFKTLEFMTENILISERKYVGKIHFTNENKIGDISLNSMILYSTNDLEEYINILLEMRRKCTEEE